MLHPIKLRKARTTATVTKQQRRIQKTESQLLVVSESGDNINQLLLRFR